MKPFLWTVTACVVMAHASAGHAQQPKGDEANAHVELARRLVGAWRLLSVETIGPNGNVLPAAWMGKNPSGLLIYQPDGVVAAQIMRDPRPTFENGSRLKASAEELKKALFGYYAYWGRYTTDASENSVVHNVEASLYPSEVGITYKRFFSFDGDKLILTTASFQYGGKKLQNRLRWERIRGKLPPVTSPENDLEVKGKSVGPDAQGAHSAKPKSDFKFHAAVYAWFPDDRVRKVSPDNGLYYQACVHPQGAHVVYSGGRSGTPRIWETDLETKETISLSPDGISARHPVYSPDGNRIAFAADFDHHQSRERLRDMDDDGRPPEGYNLNIYACDRNGGRLTRVTCGNWLEERPAWEPLRQVDCLCVEPREQDLRPLEDRRGRKNCARIAPE